MAVQYIVDGYNAAHRDGAVSGQSLAVVRQALVRRIENNRPYGSRRNTVTVVFDGRPDLPREERAAAVRVLFSRQESADALIRRMVEAAPQPRLLVVVTDDREVMYACRAAGAQVMPVARFFTRHRPAVAPRRDMQDCSPSLNPDSPAAVVITEELKRLWLKP
ncbi:MAG: NYN domain-containing protein [Candidatus Omnitrophica bacterium]|nr:NYN domain-containing protein [Candidatus Omnitrophota bacterium]